MNRVFSLVLALLLSLTALTGCKKEKSPFASVIPEAPAFTAVLDAADVLPTESERDMTAKNDALFALTGAEIAVVAVNTAEPLALSDFARQTYNKWGVGSKERGNGILILLSVGQADYYVMPGMGLTGVLTNETIQGLVRTHLEPHFANGEYGTGTAALFDAILAHLEQAYAVEVNAWSGAPGPYTPAESLVEEENGASFGQILLIGIPILLFFLILILLWNIFARKIGGGRTAYSSPRRRRALGKKGRIRRL